MTIMNKKPKQILTEAIQQAIKLSAPQEMINNLQKKLNDGHGAS